MNTTKPHRHPSIRDTDDYITARGANPRTGLISPSIYSRSRSSSPTKTITPRTPGEALELYGLNAQLRAVAERVAADALFGGAEGLESECCQTPVKKPVLKSMLTKIRRKKKTEEVIEETLIPTSINFDVSPGWDANQHTLPYPHVTGVDDSDRFIIPMPTALEPQPYKYSPAQREAYTYYLQKTWSAQDAEAAVAQDRPVDSPLQMPSTETNAIFVQPNTPIFENMPKVSDFEQPIHRGSITSIKSSSSEATESSQEDLHKPIRRKVVGSERRKSASTINFHATKWMRMSDWSRLPRVALIHPNDAATPRESPPMSTKEKQILGETSKTVDENEQTLRTPLITGLVSWIWTLFTTTILELFCTLPSLSNLQLLKKAFDVDLPGDVRFQSLKLALRAAAHLFVVLYSVRCLFNASKVVFDFLALFLFPLKVVVRILWWMVES